MPKGTRLKKDQIKQIKELNAQGKSHQDIASELNISRPAVYNAIKRAEKQAKLEKNLEISGVKPFNVSTVDKEPQYTPASNLLQVPKPVSQDGSKPTEGKEVKVPPKIMSGILNLFYTRLGIGKLDKDEEKNVDESLLDLTNEMKPTLEEHSAKLNFAMAIGSTLVNRADKIAEKYKENQKKKEVEKKKEIAMAIRRETAVSDRSTTVQSQKQSGGYFDTPDMRSKKPKP